MQRASASRLTSLAGSLARGAAIFYLLVSLPIVLVFLKNEYVRYINFQIVAVWRAAILPPRYVFCGDSITAGGRNWDIRIDRIPFVGLNLGQNGYTIYQVRLQVEKALLWRPKYIFMMAGTNDVLSHRSSLEQAARDYDDMLALFAGSNSQPVITLIPRTAHLEENHAIDLLNDSIRQLALKHHAQLIDLNPELAPEHRLISCFTLDGVHLSESAYAIWVRKIRDVLYHHSNLAAARS